MEFQILVGAGATVLLLRGKWWHSVCWICLRNIFEGIRKCCGSMCCRVWSVLGWLSPEPVVPRVCFLSLSGLSEGDWFCPPWFTLLGSAGLAGGGLHLSLHKSTVQIVTPASRSTICTASFIPGWLPGPVVLPPDPPVLLYARVILILRAFAQT